MSTHGEHPGKKTTTYYVNGETQETLEHKLAVSQILEDASFAPAADWILSRDEGAHVFADQSELVPIHKDERFTAKHKTPTPTS